MTKRAVCVVITLGILLQGCSRTEPPKARTLTVAAASDLKFALDEAIRQFKLQNAAIDIQPIYGSSGNFYTQITNNAPFDVFMSADMEYPRRLASGGLTMADGEFEYGVGRIVVWVGGASSLDVSRDGLRALTGAAVHHVAIANPEHAPYGRAAIAALKTAGLEEAVRPKLVNGENVAQALQFVQTGAADAGIVALSLALTPGGKSGRWFEIPQTDYPPLKQGGTILKWAADPAMARALRAFVIGADGRTILQQFGFSPPGR